MTPFTVIAGLGFATSSLAGIALLVLAYRTSSELGNLVFFLPLYATTVGNHRIESPHARWLAMVSWAGFLAFLLMCVVMPR